MAGNNAAFDQNKSSDKGSDELANLTGKDALENLVGEGKKYQTVEDLAKSYSHLNSHAGKLETENGVLRTDATGAKSIEDILAAVKAGADDSNKDKSHQHDQQNSDTQNQNEVSVADQIQQAFATRDESDLKRQGDANVASVVKQLGDKLGAGAREAYIAKGAALGLNLDELAAKSPAAVLALFNQGNQNQQNFNSTNSGNQNNVVDQDLSDDSPLTQSGLAKMFKEKKIDRETKFRLEHEAIIKVGADKFYGRTK